VDNGDGNPVGQHHEDVATGLGVHFPCIHIANTHINARQSSPHYHSTESIACITFLCSMPHQHERSNLIQSSFEPTRSSSHRTNQAYSMWLSVGKDNLRRKAELLDLASTRSDTRYARYIEKRSAARLTSRTNGYQVVDIPFQSTLGNLAHVS
jgi:hypothetical protein